LAESFTDQPGKGQEVFTDLTGMVYIYQMSRDTTPTSERTESSITFCSQLP